MSNELPLTLLKTVHTAADSLPRMKNNIELTDYLVEQGFRQDLVQDRMKDIWKTYSMKFGHTPTKIPNRPLPLSPPPSDHSRRLSCAESSTSSIQPVEEEVELLIQGSTDQKIPIGCTFVTDCVESCISDTIVENHQLPTENNTVRISWRRLKGLKTFYTTCKIISSDDLPDHDVRFGTGYKTGQKGTKQPASPQRAPGGRKVKKMTSNISSNVEKIENISESESSSDSDVSNKSTELSQRQQEKLAELQIAAAKVMSKPNPRSRRESEGGSESRGRRRKKG